MTFISIASQEQLSSGALLAYGPRFYDLGTQSARLANQIFKGIAPGTLPVEQADFYLSLNQRVAKNTGIDFPESVLKAADTIIR